MKKTIKFLSIVVVIAIIAALVITNNTKAMDVGLSARG